jgi:hypothetical protein
MYRHSKALSECKDGTSKLAALLQREQRLFKAQVTNLSLAAAVLRKQGNDREADAQLLKAHELRQSSRCVAAPAICPCLELRKAASLRTMRWLLHVVTSSCCFHRFRLEVKAILESVTI